MPENEEEEVGVVIYVLPTEEGLPPRAVVGPVIAGAIVGPVFTWSNDTGSWNDPNGIPVGTELAEAITAHAKSLGVEW